MSKVSFNLVCTGCKKKLVGHTAKGTVKCPYCGVENAVREIVEFTPAKPVERKPAAAAIPVAKPVATLASPAISAVEPPTQTGWGVTVVVLVASLIVGLFLAVVLSAFKGQIGMKGLSIAVGLMAFCWLCLVGVRAATGLLSKVATANLAVIAGSIKNGSGHAALGMGTVTALGLAMAAAESVGAPEGYIKAFLNRRESEHKSAVASNLKSVEALNEQQSEVRRTKDRTSWEGSDFIITNGTTSAVGLRRDTSKGSPRFVVTAVAIDSGARSALSRAWESKIPVYSRAPEIARRFAVNYPSDAALKPEDVLSLENSVRFRRLLPSSGSLVQFREAGEDRAGYLLHDGGGTFTFCNLTPKANLALARYSPDISEDQLFRIETISRNNVDGVSKITNDLQLKRAAGAAEYFVHGMLQKLQAMYKETEWPLRPHVLVDDVRMERDFADGLYQSLKSRLNSLRVEKTNALLRTLENNQSGFKLSLGLPAIIDALSGFVREREEAIQKRNVSEALQADYSKQLEFAANELAQYSSLLKMQKDLQANIPRLLVQSGVFLVERSDSAKKLYLEKVGGAQWLRPSSETAISTSLISATHLLIPQISVSPGSKHILGSIRLVDVRSGEILWAESIEKELDPVVVKSFSPVDREKAKPRVDLNGKWEALNERTFQVTIRETGSNVHVTLLSDKTLKSLEIDATRAADDKISIRSCTISNIQTRGFKSQVDAVMEIQRNGDLTIGAQVLGVTGLTKNGPIFARGPIVRQNFRRIGN